ncbi:MAG: histidine kinase [Bacteroidetes bacterium]|nr:histidine kinase [Bacteroidota bacterium]
MPWRLTLRKKYLVGVRKKGIITSKGTTRKTTYNITIRSTQNQINPHFLFNSLNTLASIIATDQDSAIKFTTKFAKMYRSILEHGEQKIDPFGKGIGFDRKFYLSTENKVW